MLFFFCCFFFFNDTATTEIYTLSLHDALPICRRGGDEGSRGAARRTARRVARVRKARSEEHTSELQSQSNLVCRLLLEKKKINFTKTKSINCVMKFNIFFVAIRPIHLS